MVAKNSSFIVICILAMFDKMIIPTFIQNASELYQTKFNLSMEESSQIISYPDIVYMILSLFVAAFVDKRGKKGIVLISGFTVLGMAHLTFILLAASPAN